MTVDLTVIIPAFNAADTIGEQLAALAAQVDGGSFEVLVCDNGSTDDTASVARSFERILPTLRMIAAHDRRGASAARNIGAHAASTSLLLFCDADDVVSPVWVREMRAALSRAAFTAGSVEHALLNPKQTWNFGWDRPTFTNEALPQLHAGGSGNMGVRRDAFAAVGGFDESLRTAEDLDFSWRLQLAGHPLVGAATAVVHVRKRGNLRGALRQAYAKGEGVRILAHRYARVREAFELAYPPPITTSTGPRTGPIPRVFQRVRKVPRTVYALVQTPSTLTPRMTAIAYRLGYRRASVHGVEQLLPPANLPAPTARGPRS